MRLSLEEMAEALEETIWSLTAHALQSAEPFFRSFLRGLNIRVIDLLDEMSDETMAVAVQKRFFRREAFERWLVCRYETLLLQWFHRQSGDRETAWELVQEFYVKLLSESTLARYQPEYQFRPWCWQVARNLYHDWCRKRGHPFATLGGYDAPAQSADPLELLQSQELHQQAARAIASLPDAQQQVLRLSMNGDSADDIAETLNMTKRRVYALLFQARRAVESGLQQVTPPGEVTTTIQNTQGMRE